MSYATPNVPLISNPINLDAAIQRIQKSLAATLPWLDYSFGRAESAERSVDGSTRPHIYPEVYAGEGQYISVEPNNHFGAHSFLVVTGPVKPKDYSALQYNIYTAPVDIVFLFDLEKIKRKGGYPYAHRYAEELKRQVMEVLRWVPDVENITSIMDTPGEVFRGYSYNQLQQQTFKHPNGGFRVALEVLYMENCGATLENPAREAGTGITSPFMARDAAVAYPFANATHLTIIHNRGRLVTVQIFDAAGRMVDADIAEPNLNTVEITFSQSLSGTALVS